MFIKENYEIIDILINANCAVTQDDLKSALEVKYLLTKYTNLFHWMDINIRQFRIRHWPSDADFEYSSVHQIMSNRNGLKLYSLSFKRVSLQRRKIYIFGVKVVHCPSPMSLLYVVRSK